MTTLTLRQAHKLVERINIHLKSLTVETNHYYNMWDAENASAWLKSKQDEYQQFLDLSFKLISARSAIRSAVQRANHSKINELISQRKLINEQIMFAQNNIIQRYQRGVTSPTTLQHKVEQLKANQSENDTIEVGMISDQLIADYKTTVAELKQQLIGLEETLLQLNVTTTITLTDDVTDLLDSQRLM